MPARFWLLALGLLLMVAYAAPAPPADTPGKHPTLPDAVTMAEVLRAASYGTYMVGQWHITSRIGPWTGDIARAAKRHWPRRVPAGGVSHAVGHVTDMMPTVLEAAGVAYPKTFEGRAVTSVAGVSLLPALSGKSLDRDTLFWEHTGHRAVRAGDWKLVSVYEAATDCSGPWELYNLATDRTELHDPGPNRAL